MESKIKELVNELYTLVEPEEGQGTSLIKLVPTSEEFVNKIKEINEFIYGFLTRDIERALGMNKNNKFVRMSVENVNFINSKLIELLIMRNNGDTVELHDTIKAIIDKIERWH